MTWFLTALFIIVTVFCGCRIAAIVNNMRWEFEDIYRWIIYKYAKKHPERSDLTDRLFGRGRTVSTPDATDWAAFTAHIAVIALLVLVIIVIWVGLSALGGWT